METRILGQSSSQREIAAILRRMLLGWGKKHFTHYRIEWERHPLFIFSFEEAGEMRVLRVQTPHAVSKGLISMSHVARDSTTFWTILESDIDGVPVAVARPIWCVNDLTDSFVAKLLAG